MLFIFENRCPVHSTLNSLIASRHDRVSWGSEEVNGNMTMGKACAICCLVKLHKFLTLTLCFYRYSKFSWLIWPPFYNCRNNWKETSHETTMKLCLFLSHNYRLCPSDIINCKGIYLFNVCPLLILSVALHDNDTPCCF